MNELDLYKFSKWLKKNYRAQTCRDYDSKMGRLKREGITENSTPTQVYETVKRLAYGKKGNETGRMYKKAVDAYCRFKRETTGEKLQLIDGISNIRFANNFKRGLEILPPKKSLQLYKRAIPKCKNEDIKLALMIELNAGLRIGEISALKDEDIRIGKDSKGNDTVWLYVRPGKTSYGRYVRVLRVDGFFNADEIYKLMEKHLKEKRRFPDKSVISGYLRGIDTKDPSSGGESHDLRKYCARGLYRQERMSGKGKLESARTVQKQLGHRNREYTVGQTRDNGGYIGKVWLEDKKGPYKDVIDWKNP